MVRPIHTCQTEPSGFRPGTTSYVMFTRYLLHPYGTIPCLYCGISRFTLLWGRVSDMSFIHSKKHFRHHGPQLRETHELKKESFGFRFLYDRHCKFSRLFHLRNYLWVSDTTLSSSPPRRIDEFWASYLFKLFKSSFRKYIKMLTFLNCSILCVPLDTPNVLYLQHYRSNSDWLEHT